MWAWEKERGIWHLALEGSKIHWVLQKAVQPLYYNSWIPVDPRECVCFSSHNWGQWNSRTKRKAVTLPLHCKKWCWAGPWSCGRLVPRWSFGFSWARADSGSLCWRGSQVMLRLWLGRYCRWRTLFLNANSVFFPVSLLVFLRYIVWNCWVLF